MEQVQHTDGLWNTTEYEYKGKRIQLKSRVNHGIKFHVWHEDKVLFTQRFRFAKPEYMLKRAQQRIDMWLSGEWTPKKLRT